MIHVSGSIDLQVILREASMILSTRLHIMEVTLSSMTLRTLNLVQVRRLRKSGNLLRSDLLQQSWKINYMQFGTFQFINHCNWVTNLAAGIVYHWIALALFCLQNFNSSIKGQGKVNLQPTIHYHGSGLCLGCLLNKYCKHWVLNLIYFMKHQITLYWLLNYTLGICSSHGGYIYQIWCSNNPRIWQIKWCTG